MRPCSLLLAWLLTAPVCAGAGNIQLPSDISISLSAEPGSNLQPGQRVTFTLSVTNHGPESINGLWFGSSPIHDEFDVGSGSIIECDGVLALAVVDTEDSFYYVMHWFAALPELESFRPGEIRSCQFSNVYTGLAPPVFPFTFDMSGYIDADPANNAATVYLRGAEPATPVPVLSSGWRALLLALIACIGAVTWRARTLGRRYLCK